jgi:branched-chain amino acid transport system permease protein
VSTGRQSPAVMVVLAVGLAAVPLFLGKYHLSVLILAGHYAIACIGLNLLVGYTGQISFGHNAFIGLGAYATAVMTTRLGWPSAVALAAGLVLTAVVALGIGVPTLRLRGHSLAMGTVALGVVAHVVFNEVEPITRGILGIGNIPPLSLGPWALDSDVKYYHATWIIVLASIWMCRRLISSRVGRALIAIRDNAQAARAMGIDVAGYKIRIFVLSALFASLSGSLYAHWVAFISPELFTLDIALFLVVVLLTGGIGTLWGAPVGALALTILGEALRASKSFNQLIFGVLLIVVLLFAPNGLTGFRDAFRRLFLRESA